MNRFNISGKIGSAGVNHLPKADTSNEPIRNGTKQEQEQEVMCDICVGKKSIVELLVWNQRTSWLL
jgi:hypothetical protein